ncbi:MAG: phosphatidate cytidylyltransferase [Propionibacteriaceae bacterium]|nr:phosphatidate cytidylyltransferase [Propionibacteriaceae bacterium]
MIGLIGGEAATLLLGTLGVLAVATVIVLLVSWRLRGEKHAALTLNLRQRTGAWWIMIGILAVGLALGETALIVLFAALSFVGLREMVRLVPEARGDREVLVWLVLIGTLHWFFVWRHWYGMFAIFVPVYAFLFLPAVAALRARVDGFLHRTAAVQWMLMVSVYALSHVPAILQLTVAIEGGREAAEGSAPGTGGTASAALLLWLVIVVQGSDVLQYVWGKTLGRHPIAPTVSPNKTWEGFLGGIASATALGVALWWATPFAPWQAGVLAFVSCVMGFLGGLVMSALKRDSGIKDFGTLIPGHGGIMDRFDSLVFAAPIFFHLTRFFFT